MLLVECQAFMLHPLIEKCVLGRPAGVQEMRVLHLVDAERYLTGIRVSYWGDQQGVRG